MTNVQTMTDEALAYVASDCRTAIAAMPAGYKVRDYLSTAEACDREQGARARKRIWRRMLRDHLRDPLARVYGQEWTYAQAIRNRREARQRNGNGFQRDQWRTAAFSLAWVRLYNV